MSTSNPFVLRYWVRYLEGTESWGEGMIDIYRKDERHQVFYLVGLFFVVEDALITKFLISLLKNKLSSRSSCGTCISGCYWWCIHVIPLILLWILICVFFLTRECLLHNCFSFKLVWSIFSVDCKNLRTAFFPDFWIYCIISDCVAVHASEFFWHVLSKF